MTRDAEAVPVERRTPGEQPEAEVVVIRLFGDWAVLALDDGEELLFETAALRKALGTEDQIGRAA